MSAVFAYLGWVWLVAALGTTAVALALAAWRTWRPGRPQVQHRVAVVALASCLILVVIAPLALTADAGRPAPASQAPRGSRPVASAAEVSGPALAQRSRESTQGANAVAGAVGALWLFGVALMSARLLGGWVVVRRLVRSARPTGSSEMQAAAARVHSVMGVRTPVRVFESSQVDVPIVVGCRPVLILPPDLHAGSSAETFEPLLAHELAHVVRRDYLMNMLQSGADAVLFALPGARWISARVRETREYCCDEIALHVCGDTRRYVEALAGIATLSVARQPVAALGVGGPRLATRIRRLLHGDPQVRHRRARLIALMAVTTLAVVVSDRAVSLAASQVAQLPSSEEQRVVPTSTRAYELHMSWAVEQPGSAVVLKRRVSGVAFGCDTAEVQNEANVTVTGLAFVAVVTLSSGYDPVTIFTTDVIPVNIAPGAIADVDVHLLSQADQTRLGAIAPKVYVTCALTKVAYANGASWEITPNPAARTADAALSLPPAQVSRSLISAAPTPGWLCRDDSGGEYSMGALVPIRNEPGTLARCVDASAPGTGQRAVRWVDYPASPRK
jgi:beta-lactamase regulating signal transducer with metallopeptidase domain